MLGRKKIALGLGAAALALGAGVAATGIASAAVTPGPSPSATSTEVPGSGQGRANGGPGHKGPGVQAAELAARLGVEEAKVSEALQAFREANKPVPGSGVRPDRAAMEAQLAASLAQSLGLDEEKVTTALAEIRSAEQSERAAALKTRLDAAVADGTLTQAEADGAAKAVEKGVIGGGR